MSYGPTDQVAGQDLDRSSLKGISFEGAATQLQTTISAASGENADITNSILGVSFILAIFVAGVIGTLLISNYNGMALSLVMTGPRPHRTRHRLRREPHNTPPTKQ